MSDSLGGGHRPPAPDATDIDSQSRRLTGQLYARRENRTFFTLKPSLEKALWAASLKYQVFNSTSCTPSAVAASAPRRRRVLAMPRPWNLGSHLSATPPAN